MMTADMPHHVIYIPGIGDDRTFGQDRAINLWRLFGLTPHYMALGWKNREGFEAKCNRILAKIDELAASGDPVSLVGVSAGASAALNAYVASTKVTGAVYICGKINNPQVVRPRVYQANPDFKESLDHVKDSLGKLEDADRRRMLSIHPFKDMSVPIGDTKIPGVAEMTVPGWSHVQGIFAGVVFGGPAIGRFLRRLEQT